MHDWIGSADAQPGQFGELGIKQHIDAQLNVGRDGVGNDRRGGGKQNDGLCIDAIFPKTGSQ